MGRRLAKKARFDARGQGNNVYGKVWRKDSKSNCAGARVSKW